MARRWDNQEVAGRGTKFCLVIDPEDGTNPIRTYGWSKDEVLEKVAKTAETAQQVINRQRAGAPAAQVRPATISSEEQMQATADLSNPAKAPDAIKTLLRGAGFDVDQERLKNDANRVAVIAEEWERNNPDFPKDDRNKRLLMDKACLMVGFINITAEALDRAYQELQARNMLFEDAPSTEEEGQEETPIPTNAPSGNSATRIDRTRTATSYRRAELRTTTPSGNREPKYTRADVDAMNSKQLRDKIENDPAFVKWYNSEFSAAQ